MHAQTHREEWGVCPFIELLGFLLPTQVMALIIIVVGMLSATFFYACAREESTLKQPKLKWYKWFGNLQFYMVG